MKDEKIIKKITIEIAGIEVEVTPKQAKSLHEALGELLGISATPQIVQQTIYRDRYPWSWPTVTWYSTVNGVTSTPPNKYDVFCSYQAKTGTAKLQVNS